MTALIERAPLAEAVSIFTAAAATGIADKLTRAGHRWFALLPRWNVGTERKSAHPVLFFLDPTEQDRLEAGWYTVEEIDAMIEGRGPAVRLS